MNTPFNTFVITGPGFVNPMASMPAEQFGRSIDKLPDVSSPGGGGGGGVTPPLWLYAVDTENVKVTFGQVSGFTPTGVATNIDVSGTDGTWNIYMDATVDAATGAVTAADVSSNTSTVPSDSSTHSYRLIGTVIVSSSLIVTVNPSMAWSQTFVACTPGDSTTYYWVVA